MLYYTYELYLDDEEGRRWFEALTCPEEQIMAELQRVLKEREARSVEVHRLGALLFTVNRGAEA